MDVGIRVIILSAMEKELQPWSALREARKNAGLTQADVSKKLKVTQQAVGTWETGRAVPSSAILLKLSKLYKTPTDTLLCQPDRVTQLEHRLAKLEKIVERIAK